MQTEMTAYERDRAERAAVAERRHALAVAAAEALAGWLTGGGTAIWKVERTQHPHEMDGERIEVTNGHAHIVVHAGGYKRENRLVAFVPTSRQVKFGGNDWDTVSVSYPGTEATVDETKDTLQVAKEFARKLGPVALAVAAALDAEYARMLAERDKAQAVLQEFRVAGWVVREHNGFGRATVPEGHALTLLGVHAIKVDMETGGMDYDYRAYLPHDTVPAQLIGLTLRKG